MYKGLRIIKNMKIGSLVGCVDNIMTDDRWITPKLETVYTVRDLNIDPLTGVGGLYVEEIVNGTNGMGLELGYKLYRFRELMPPMENVEEYIKENSLELEEA